jgi:hypothetical protein
MLNNLKKYRYDSLVVIALVVVTAAVYGQVLNHEFIIYDDPAYVTENYVVREGVSWKGFLWAFTTLAAANWHPLTWLSHMLDVQLFGMQPGMHHLVNVFFHVLNTALLFLVLRQMTGALWRSAFVAALFALHPLHVESVAWVAERKDVLSSFFWLLTMWAYARYAQKPGLPSYWPVLLFFSLGLLAKPMLVSLPLVLFLMDYWPLGRLRGKRETAQAPMTSSAMPEKQGKKRKQQLRVQKRPPAAKGAGKWAPILPLVYEKIPLLALSAASSMITLYAQQKGGGCRAIVCRAAGGQDCHRARILCGLLMEDVLAFRTGRVLSPGSPSPRPCPGKRIPAAGIDIFRRAMGGQVSLSPGGLALVSCDAPARGRNRQGRRCRNGRPLYVHSTHRPIHRPGLGRL